MSRQQPIVSVVTPVYNGAAYIAECVESVLAQTCERFEYIVVDNCSSDATPEIVARCVSGDPRVRFVAAETFVSAIANANRALRLISPESTFTKVVHADDFILPGCLEAMVGLATDHPAVGLVGAHRRENGAVTLTGVPRELSVIPGRDAGRAHLLGPWGYFLGSPTSVLYRSDLVRRRPSFYNVGNPFQADQEACLDVLQESDFGFVHEVLTFTRRHEGAQSPYFFRIGADIPGQIDLLLRYGGAYLSEQELQRRLAAQTFAYAASLLAHPGRLRDSESRAFHRQFVSRLQGAVSLRGLAAGTWRGLLRRLRG